MNEIYVKEEKRRIGNLDENEKKIGETITTLATIGKVELPLPVPTFLVEKKQKNLHIHLSIIQNLSVI